MDILKLLEKLKVRDFKIVGKKVIIKELEISNNVSNTLFDKLKYELFVESLYAAYVPECIKYCNKLSLTVGKRFSGYLPKVKTYLVIKKENQLLKNVNLGSIDCTELLLLGHKYEGNIKTNALTIGDDYNYSEVGNLSVEGIGLKPILLSRIRDCYDRFVIKDFSIVRLRGLNNFKSNGCMEISNCKLLDLSGLYHYYDDKRITLNNVDTLEVYSPFKSNTTSEVNKVVFTNSNFLKELPQFKSTFICKEVVLDNNTYTKDNQHQSLTKIIKFK